MKGYDYTVFVLFHSVVTSVLTVPSCGVSGGGEGTVGVSRRSVPRGEDPRRRDILTVRALHVE